MLETLTLCLFIALLLTSALSGFPIVLALVISLGLFVGYCLVRKIPLQEIFHMLKEGFSGGKSVFLTMLFIGMVTGIWRSCGTIPYIIYHCAHIISPRFFLVGIFLFNGFISTLIGSSFGTASTSGVISMSLALTLGINPLYAGGAILSGAFLGDRCSPMSTSALLVATLSGSPLWVNLKNMFRTAIVPFFISLAIFQYLNSSASLQLQTEKLEEMTTAFVFHPLLLLPVVFMLVLSVARVPIRRAMSVSIITALPLCFFLQHRSLPQVMHHLFLGYVAPGETLGALLNGGGMISMSKACIIVAVSSSFFGIFQHTQLLDGVKKFSSYLYGRFPHLLVMQVMSLFLASFSSNQTLCIMLTAEMSKEEIENPQELALHLENSAIYTPCFIPWNIAGRTPLETVGAPLSSLFFAVYLYVLMLYNLLIELAILYRKK